jgi:leucyl-tRNA synthetase
MSKYDFSKIESKWQRMWKEKRVYEPDFTKARKPFYNLMMFPYPSAEGLHVGNMYAFTGSDIYGRFKRMQGYDVFEPMGLDGFGIHSENYALKIGAHPMEQAKKSQANFYRQLGMIGNGFAWDEHLETYDPAYYRWTQWIFTEMFRRGLAYRKKQPVNWCPSCKTVLADEQAASGRCERCGTAVVKKDLEQWFFKITDYAERLLKNLETLDWSERVKIAQRNWIGRSEGVMMHSKIKGLDIKVEAFDSVPQTFMAQTFTVIAPEHPLVPQLVQGTPYKKPVLEFIEKIKKAKAAKKGYDPDAEPEGIFTGRYVEDPFGTGDLPIWVASFVVMEYGTGIVYCSAHDERDFTFAKKYKIPLRPVMFPKDAALAKEVRNLEFAYCKDPEGILEQPNEFAGRRWGEVRKDIIAHLEKKGIAKRTVHYRLRDWLISRQRYWGPPIPMLFCEACAAAGRGERKEMPGWYAVPEKDLPVRLPFVKDFRPKGKGQSPLASVKSFYETKCPKCGGKARRETDVSDTFLDSAWYYLRYPSVREKKAPWNPVTTKKWLPVDMYIGGAEHSVLHLLYVRFLALALHNLKLLKFGDSPAPVGEPFPKFRAHGLLIRESAKMSKSKGNVINPDEYIAKFGADALRMYLMFLAPFEQGGDFRDAGIMGVVRFLGGVWRFESDHAFIKEEEREFLDRLLHRTIKKVTEDIEVLKYNTAISALMILFGELERYGNTRETWSIFLKLLAPFAPHLTEELWEQLLHGSTRISTRINADNNDICVDQRKYPRESAFRSIHLEPWPTFDPKLIEEKTFTLVIQVNGKVRDSVEASVAITEAEVRKLALGRENVKRHLGAAAPKRVIYVPRRLVNIVV